MWRPGDCKLAIFESRCMLSTGAFQKDTIFYFKYLLLGAIVSEAARQLTGFSGLLIDKIT